MSSRYLREIIHNLFHAQCVWCGKRVVLTRRSRRSPLPHNASTVDHVDQRADGNRSNRCRVVCACHECNQNRSAESVRCLKRGIQRQVEQVPLGLPVIIVDDYGEIVPNGIPESFCVRVTKDGIKRVR